MDSKEFCQKLVAEIKEVRGQDFVPPQPVHENDGFQQFYDNNKTLAGKLPKGEIFEACGMERPCPIRVNVKIESKIVAEAMLK